MKLTASDRTINKKRPRTSEVKARKPTKYTKICQYCGIKFDCTNNRAKYCGYDCSNKGTVKARCTWNGKKIPDDETIL